MKALLRIAWRNLWRHRRRSLVTAAAMAVGVALCMWMICLTDGTYGLLFDLMVEEQLGHAQVNHPDYPASHAQTDTLPESTLATVDAVPGTRIATGRLVGFALVGGDEKSEGAQLVGVLPAREAAVRDFAADIVAGAWLGEAPEQGIVLGHTLARELEVGVGDEVVAVTQAADGSLGNALYTVKGLVKTGQTALDAHGAFLHLRDVQELLVLPDRVHEITVLVDDRDGVDAWRDAAAGTLGSGALVRPWWEVAPQLREMLELQDAFAFVTLGLVFAVAGLGVVNTMLMSVFERTRELGVMKALGLRPGRIVLLVVFESLLLAGLSLVLGLILGGLLDWWMVRYGIDFSGSMGTYDAMGLSFDPVMKGAFRVGPVVWTVLSVLVVAVLAALWPAARAARLHPVDAIRTE